MRVLLVEDNEANAAAVGWALTEEGFHVITVHRGKEVLAAISSNTLDAVILDISLPDLNGIEVAKLIRSHSPQLSIVFTTGHDRYVGLDAALAMPRTWMLMKPFTIAMLAATLRGMGGAVDRT